MLQLVKTGKLQQIANRVWAAKGTSNQQTYTARLDTEQNYGNQSSFVDSVEHQAT